MRCISGSGVKSVGCVVDLHLGCYLENKRNVNAHMKYKNLHSDSQILLLGKVLITPNIPRSADIEKLSIDFLPVCFRMSQ